MRAQHYRLTRPSRPGDRRNSSERLLNIRDRPDGCGRGDRCGAIGSMVTHKGANAFFTSQPVASASAVHVKIDESRQNEGTFWLGARRHPLSVDNRDRLANKVYLAGHPSVGRENGAFWRCRGSGGHSFAEERALLWCLSSRNEPATGQRIGGWLKNRT